MMGDAHLPQLLNVNITDDKSVSNWSCSPATAVVVVVIDAGNLACLSWTWRNFKEEFQSVVITNHNTLKFFQVHATTKVNDIADIDGTR